MGQRTRITTCISVLAVALLMFAIFATGAFAVAGDSPLHASDLSAWLGSSLTTSMAGITGAGPDTDYYFKMQLLGGETLSADFTSITTSPTPINFKAFGYVRLTSHIYQGRWLDGEHSHYNLTFTAPSTAAYTIETPSSLPGTFTVTPTVHGVIVPTVLTSKPKHTKSTKFQGSLIPGGSTVVTITIQKYKGSSAKKYKVTTVRTTGAGVWAYSKKLPAGKYRIMASTTSSSSFPYTASSPWTGFKVK